MDWQIAGVVIVGIEALHQHSLSTETGRHGSSSMDQAYPSTASQFSTWLVLEGLISSGVQILPADVEESPVNCKRLATLEGMAMRTGSTSLFVLFDCSSFSSARPLA